MKKLALLLGMTLIATSASVMANSHPVGWPNFTDNFTATLSNVLPVIQMTGHEGTVIDDGNATCADTTCTFHIKDNEPSGTGGSGEVYYTIGDKADGKAYCDLQITDGAWISGAVISKATCSAGITNPTLQKDAQYDYSFTIAAPAQS